MAKIANHHLAALALLLCACTGTANPPTQSTSNGSVSLRLERAIVEQDIDGVRSALAAGANPNARLQGTKRFPLHEAALRGNPSIAGALLRSGAEVDLPDDENYTPLAMSFRASPMGYVARVLLAAGADPNRRQGRAGSQTALGLAAVQGGTGVCRVLAESRASLEDRIAPPSDLSAPYPPIDQERWWTPLMAAAYHCNAPCLAALAERGADPKARTTRGLTAWDLACQSPSSSPDSIRAVLAVASPAIPANPK